MDMLLTSVLIVSLISLAVLISVRNIRFEGEVTKHNRLVPIFLVSDAILLVMNLSIGGNVPVKLLADLSFVLLPMLLLHSSLMTDPHRERWSVILMIFTLAPAAHHVLCMAGAVSQFSDHACLCFASFAACVPALLFIVLLWRRISDMRAVMHSGTVWSFVCIGVDAVYSLAAPVVLLLCSVISLSSWDLDGVHMWAAVVMLGLELLALGIRTGLDSQFVIRQKREMMIVESMKVSQMEYNSFNSKLDELYKDIYERVVLYFEMDKPFLDGNLSINDVVKVVYSNKVYISKAIGHYTGRNFCQFVNYYRVIHSMDLFRGQPGLKVSELAGMSGFNCTVSFTTAFRLFMNETPSEWCRKERTKLRKTKK